MCCLLLFLLILSQRLNHDLMLWKLNCRCTNANFCLLSQNIWLENSLVSGWPQTKSFEFIVGWVYFLVSVTHVQVILVNNQKHRNIIFFMVLISNGKKSFCLRLQNLLGNSQRRKNSENIFCDNILRFATWNMNLWSRAMFLATKGKVLCGSRCEKLKCFIGPSPRLRTTRAFSRPKKLKLKSVEAWNNKFILHESNRKILSGSKFYVTINFMSLGFSSCSRMEVNKRYIVPPKGSCIVLVTFAKLSILPCFSKQLSLKFGKSHQIHAAYFRGNTVGGYCKSEFKKNVMDLLFDLIIFHLLFNTILKLFKLQMPSNSK